MCSSDLIISEKIGEGAESGQVISDAVSTQQVSFNEILRTAQELARLASEMDESVSVVNDGAGTGKAKLTNMKQTFDQVTEQTSLLAAKSRTLSERTDVIQSDVACAWNLDVYQRPVGSEGLSDNHDSDARCGGCDAYPFQKSRP